MKKLTVVAALLSSMVFSSTAVAQSQPFSARLTPEIKAALSNDLRQDANTKRDIYRHPGETLSFFGIKPTDTVIEFWPGAGVWYAEILAPYLAKQGHYIAANFETNPPQDVKSSDYLVNAGKKFEAWLSKNQAVLGKASIVTFQPPRLTSLGDDNSADAVLTFRNLHNWGKVGELETAFNSAYKVLKSGGVFGVVEHRANAGMGMETGYMQPDEVIALAKKVGFTLVATSEINANPKDTKDYPKGVWTLPPRLSLGEQDKAKYLAIGESDRMTLKFIKK